jgi:hypothetical protein
VGSRYLLAALEMSPTNAQLYCRTCESLLYSWMS